MPTTTFVARPVIISRDHGTILRPVLPTSPGGAPNSCTRPTCQRVERVVAPRIDSAQAQVDLRSLAPTKRGER